jgi:tripartite-type tricarboxylate transporter receptor subunit TctC
MARTVAFTLAAMLALAGAAAAQEWPTRPVTMVVPFAAGGPVDTSARIVAARLTELLGQPVIIENVAGAGSMTGANRVAKAPPDGSVFLYGNSSTHTFSQLLYKAPLYDAVSDFAPVAAFVENSKVLIARKDFPADTLADFTAYVRAHQARLQYGSAGAGSAAHVTCVLLNSAIGVEVTHIPYRGLAPTLQDLIGGRIDYICEIISTALPQIRAKAVKALAILSPQPQPGAARPSHRRRAGAARLRRRRLECILLSQRHAGPDHPPTRAGDEQGGRYPCGARAPGRPRADHRRPGTAQSGLRGATGSERAQEMGAGDQGEWGGAGLSRRGLCAAPVPA